MKKVVSVLLLLVICFTLCSCGGNDKAKDEIESEINLAVNTEAYIECKLKYEDVKGVLAKVATTHDNEDGTYVVYGTVIVNDVYNQHYEGKFDAIVSIDENGEGSCDYFYLETPVKTDY